MSVFRPGSTSPSAILFDAWENFSRRSPKADESIRSIRPELAAAVDECIDAAAREWEPYWQRRLLNVSRLHVLASFCLTMPNDYRLRSLGGRSWTCTTRRTSCTSGKL